MLEPWILPRDIGSIPMGGTKIIWMPAHIVKHLKHVYLYSSARPTNENFDKCSSFSINDRMRPNFYLKLKFINIYMN